MLNGIYPVLFSKNLLVQEAIAFCKEAHGDQKRKYTGEPYYTHCFEVASLVLLVRDSTPMVIAALLHDVLEDTAITRQEIADRFGSPVAFIVEALTDTPRVEGGPNREERKRLDRSRLAKASWEAQTIKCADIISNTGTIVKYDPSFAKIYLYEVKALHGMLTQADPNLHTVAGAILDQTFFHLIGHDQRKAEILKGNYDLFKRRAKTYDKQTDREEAEKDAQRVAEEYLALTGRHITEE